MDCLQIVNHLFFYCPIFYGIWELLWNFGCLHYVRVMEKLSCWPSAFIILSKGTQISGPQLSICYCLVYMNFLIRTNQSVMGTLSMPSLVVPQWALPFFDWINLSRAFVLPIFDILRYNKVTSSNLAFKGFEFWNWPRLDLNNNKKSFLNYKINI